PQDHARFLAVAEAIAALAPDRDSRVLDVGCATGGMLATLRRKGYRSLLGLDPSPQCARLAKKNLAIAVHVGSVTAIPGLKRRFDIITILGVLEHLIDPRRVLRDIRAALAPGGVLYVSVPDAGRFAERMDSPYQQFSLEHIMYFTADSLNNLLRGAGFERIGISQLDVPYTNSYRYPLVDAVFRTAAAAPAIPDAAGAKSIAPYLAASAEMESVMAARIRRLSESGEPILVWGAGTMTQRLMEKTSLSDARIVAFVDSNPHYQGKRLKGVPIIAPTEVTRHSETIVIGSLIFESEIRDQIRNRLGCGNPIVTLRPAD
ncbi:MAG: class I SAM-dependent methyltransferase, partial [Opitutaceae bacterium]